MGFVDELSNERKHIKDIEIQAYEKVLNQCLEHIKFINRQGKTATVFQIPVFISGYPLVDTQNCLYFLQEKLKRLKLKVLISKPNSLIVSWN